MSLPFSTAQVQALVRLRTAHPTLRVVLIGAGAITTHRPDFRPTSDLDLVLVAPLEDFPVLLAQVGWTPHPKHQHRYRSQEGAWLDVLPATDEVVQSGVVHFADGLTMSAIGFDLVLTHTDRVSLAESVDLELATLPVLLILKMIAWLERPIERGKDLEDIVFLLERGLGEDDDRRWDADHPVGASGLAFDQQSAHFMGLELAGICTDAHRGHVVSFLSRVDDSDSAAFGRMLRASHAVDEDSTYLIGLLHAFRRGFG